MKQNRTNETIEKLKAQKRQILQKLAQLQETLHAKIDPDFEDAVFELEAQENAAALSQALNERLRSIEEALRQSQQGQYGICERCGKPIDPARLEILPETVFCTDCKQAIEKRT